MTVVVGCVVAILAFASGVAIGVRVRRTGGAADAPTAPYAATVDEPTVGPSWSAVVDQLGTGLAVMDPAGAIVYRNTSAASRDGTHTGVLLTDAVNRALRRAQRGETTRQPLQLYGPPEVAVIIAANRLPDGFAVATVEDVSERRRLDAVRTDFVANTSHELKTPIGALAVLAEALADEHDLSVVHRVADRMVSEAHRVARTIDDLMELSRIELGGDPVRDRVDVAHVVTEAVERAASLAESREIVVAALDLPDDVHVVGDHRQLSSALGNLVENAVKYSESGGSVQIRVRTQSGHAELMVADHGIGIPTSEHARIFERFYRVDKGRGRDTGGTGLGLSIVRHVATNHGGEVLVSSQEGEGSTFVLRLPLAPSPSRRSSSPREGAATS